MTSLPIPIPSGYKISVKVDQKVSQGDIIATSEEIAPQDLIVEIAKDLGVDPKNSKKFIIKKPGERIEISDLIARKVGMFGTREIRSKVSGTIVNFDSANGSISIRSDQEQPLDNKTNITSPVDGKVSLCDNDKVVIDTDKEAILAQASSGETSFGDVWYSEKDLESSELSEEVSGKILVTKILSRELIAKAMGLSAAGLIAQEISEETFENLKSKKIKTPVLKVSGENFKKLAKKNEKLMLDSENLVIIKL